MKIYAIKFKEKKGKEYISILFQTKTEQEFKDKLNKWLEQNELDYGFDIDKRTISWSGNSIPLSHNEPLIIYSNLDLIT